MVRGERPFGFDTSCSVLYALRVGVEQAELGSAFPPTEETSARAVRFSQVGKPFQHLLMGETPALDSSFKSVKPPNGLSRKRQRYKQRQAGNRIREKIKNLVKDLHNKVSSFLVNNYKVIFLPTFETSQMVLKQQRKIRSKTARNMLTWSHFRFAQHLTQMAARNNCIVVRCNESYTSKTCPECGTIHEKLGSSKLFKCPSCNYKAERDANGARNIMIRALQATAITFTGDAIHLISSL